MWEYWESAVPAKQKKTSSNEKNKSQKYTNKQNNQNLGRQTQLCCVNNGSMYNKVKSIE